MVRLLQPTMDRFGIMLKTLLKALLLLLVISVLLTCLFYESSFTAFIKNKIMKKLRAKSDLVRKTTSHLNRYHISNTDFTSSQGRKIFFVSDYLEQLTKATDNLLQLTALAAYCGRQVVVPFVKDSFFHGTVTGGFNKTLAFYYNITALNNTIRSHSHATLINWSEFQDVCKGRLDVLVSFDYTNLSTSTAYSKARPFIPCENHSKIVQDIKIAKTICVNVFALDSVEKFENEVAERLACVGILKWMGVDKAKPFRAQFDLKSVVHNEVLSHRDVNVLFNSKQLRIAKDFIAKSIGPMFISVHIRTEQILKRKGSLSSTKKCILNLATRVHKIMQAGALRNTVFMATDFSEFGSSGAFIKPARENARSLMKILSPLKPITFQPLEYNLTDGGAAAIVEMNILASGTHLIVLGGGSFQRWIETQFLNKNGNDRTKVERIDC